MKRLINAIAVIMLVFAVVCVACTKDDDENGNGGEAQYAVINVSVNPANGGTVSGGGSFEKEQSCTVTAIPSADYVFKNWTENGSQVSSDANYTFTVTGNRDLVANFTYNGGAQIQYFTVNVSSNPVEGGEVRGGGIYREGKPLKPFLKVYIPSLIGLMRMATWFQPISVIPLSWSVIAIWWRTFRTISLVDTNMLT